MGNLSNREEQAYYRRLVREEKDGDPVAVTPLEVVSTDPLNEAYAALAGSGTESNGIASTKQAVFIRVLSSSC